MKKTIRVYLTDFWGLSPHNNFLIDILKKHYDVIIDRENPDFLFYSCCDYNHLKYDCVKIFYTAENTSPDFNTAD